VNDWSSDDESESQLCNDSRLNINPARGGRLPQQSQRRPARKTVPFVPYAEWVPDQSYDELPPSCMPLYDGMEVDNEQKSNSKAN